MSTTSPRPAAHGPAPFETRTADVLGTTMAYWDEGEGDPIVLLHGNPTSKQLWRDVVPHLTGLGRCVVPDLVGMGESAKLPGEGDDRYRFVEHRRYLDALLDQLGVTERVTLVVHDWGGGLGFSWAADHPDAVRAIAFTETVCGPVSLADWPDSARDLFAAMRSPAGEKIVLTKNVYLEPGEDRRPTLTWPRQIPFDGEPADVHAIAERYSAWLAETDVPKLHLRVEPGFLTGVYEDRIATWPAVTEVTLPGIHFVQEDAGDEMGQRIADWLGGLD